MVKEFSVSYSCFKYLLSFSSFFSVFCNLQTALEIFASLTYVTRKKVLQLLRIPLRESLVLDMWIQELGGVAY